MRVSWVGVLEVNVCERELEIAMVIHLEICELYINYIKMKTFIFILSLVKGLRSR